MGNTPSELSPRQRMINMMYIVLTALLALNVSKELLTAFITVNKGLKETNQNFARKTRILYNDMDKQYELDSVKVHEYYQKTQKAKRLTKDMVGYIDHLKNILVSYCETGDTTEFKTTWENKEERKITDEWKDVPVAHLEMRRNYDKPTQILVPKGDANAKKGYGYDLKQKIEQYKKDMRNIFNKEEDRKRLNLGLNTDSVYSRIEEATRSWQTYNFYSAILAADVVFLNKLVAEIRNAEANVVSRLLSKISLTDFKFDRVEAKVIPNKSYVMQGEKYKADIFVAAISETQQPEVYVLEGADTSATKKEILNKGKRVDSVHKGMTKYIVSPNNLGERQYAGVVKMRVPGKQDKYNRYRFTSNYIVAKPTAVISATKVNVFYIGVKNPVEVSAPGIANSRLSVTASNASVSGSAGKYKITPHSDAREVIVRANASQKEGSGSKFMGKMKYRVKRLPDPQIKIANRGSGETIRKIALLNQRLIAKLNALFDVKYKVISFKMEVTIGGNTYGERTTGNELSQKMKGLVKRLGRGDNVRFRNITVMGPDGKRNVEGIFYKIK